MNTATPQVPNNLVWAILSTLFCCLPAGIVSIVYAAQVNGKLAAGDIRIDVAQHHRGTGGQAGGGQQRCPAGESGAGGKCGHCSNGSGAGAGSVHADQ